ncbi:DUF5666 domain-containing protein [Marinimicrobium alkaliphilum]|uniref:DUF5666 domain-containing protein n=1 Tax=Marinimicrobium alkaliphilum TaxID=2202654 RepID=UPI001300B623|nr:DUF5666 domain-containing protein [Marinimicrobium alkaliphilum]
MKHLKKSALATSIALVLTGCGGSSSDTAPDTSNPDNNLDNGGSTGSSTRVSSSGVITGFGSIFVNGVRYDTATAEIEFDGEGLKTEDDLRLGMRVAIEAAQEGEERRATRVVFDKDLKGPVSSVSPNADNPARGTLVVLGQTVTVDANTILGGGIGDANMDGRIDLNDLDSTEGRVVVEVSGFLSDTGYIATRLDRLNSDDDDDDDNEVEIKGIVSDLDTDNGTFMIRSLLVTYDLTVLNDDIEEGQLSNGWFVDVEGELQADGSLLATEIEREDDFDDDDRDGEFEIEGFIQAVDTESTPNTVTINGLVVPVTDASLLANLIGVKVEVEGSFNAQGHLEIDIEDGIEWERTNNVEISDRVETVGTDSFTTRLGITVTPTGRSRVEDDGEDGDRLKPEDFMARLQAGDAIEARGYLAEDGTLTWNRIERDSDEEDMDCSLRGPVEAGSIDVSSGIFTILGVSIDTSSIMDEDNFGDTEDNSLGRVNFFNILETEAGAVVEAESDEDNTAGCSNELLIAEEVEFKWDDDVATTFDRDDDDDDDDDEDDDFDDDEDDDQDDDDDDDMDDDA